MLLIAQKRDFLLFYLFISLDTSRTSHQLISLHCWEQGMDSFIQTAGEI